MLEHFAALHAQVTHGLGRGRPAVHVELGLVAAVRAQMGGQNPAIFPRACLLLRLKYQRTAPSPNSTQVVRSFQSRIREKVSAPITSARL